MALRPSTEERKARFLAEYRERGSIVHAARTAGIHRRTVYLWRETDPAFLQAFIEAREDVLGEVEASLFERAKAGDTRAGIFILSHRMPEVYGRQRGAGARKPEPEMSDAELAHRLRAVLRQCPDTQ